jgi:glycerophosphoryl diester phosphodiesterase
MERTPPASFDKPAAVPSENRWLSTREPRSPLNIAHRGASREAPGNTLAAFRLAAQMGADAIELDVHLSADGVPVVIHDFSVDRTTNGTGKVSALTLGQMRQLDVVSAFHPAFAGERIPSLAEVLQAVDERLLLNIELKGLSYRDSGLARAVIGVVSAAAIGDRCLLSSFNPFLLRRAKQLAPEIPVGLLYSPDLPLPLRRVWAGPFVKHEARHPQHTMVDHHYLGWARRRGYRVNTWTVDDRAEMRRLIRLGVDGVITNRPDVLLGELLSADQVHEHSA